MAKRISALDGHIARGALGAGGRAVVLRESPPTTLHQIGAWHNTLAEVGQRAAVAANLARAPRPGESNRAGEVALLRVEPLTWWLINAAAPQLQLPPELGATLDLSHARTRLRISGAQAAALLNRHLPLDLREHAFPPGAVAATAFHHVGVTLWRTEDHYELFIPRGFALSLWQLLCESAAQFGGMVEV